MSKRWMYVAAALLAAAWYAPGVRAQEAPVGAEPEVEVETVAEPEVEAETVTEPAAGAATASQTQAAAAIEVGSEAGTDEEVVLVLGSRLSRVPGAVHVLSTEQLERFEYDDPHLALAQVPGVYVRQEDALGLRPNIGLRGANADRSKKVTLLEDGVLFGPAPYSAPAAYYFPLLTRMTDVRVIKGPSAIAHGPQTVGGAIDFLTREIPTGVRAALDLGYGEYGHTKAHAYFGASAERHGFLIEGVRLHNNGFKELPDDADTGFTRNEWMVKAFYELGPSAHWQNTLQLKLTYSDEVSNETYLGLSDEDFRENPYQRYPASALDQMKNDRTSVVLSHLLEASDYDFRLTTTAYRHDYRRGWRKLNRLRGTPIPDVLANPDELAYVEAYGVLRGEIDSLTAADALLIGPNDRTFVNQGIQTLGQLLGDTGPIAHSLEAGARLHYDSIKRRHSQDAFLMLDGELVPEGTPTQVTTVNEADTLALALHVLDAMSWRGLTLAPGVRLEIIRSQTDDLLTGDSDRGDVVAVMPGVGAFYAILDELGVLAGVYRGFSPPAPGSGEEVNPEYSVNYEAGARFTHELAHVELIGFYNDYSNLTDVCTLASGCLDENLDRQFDAGRAHIYGFEAFAKSEPSVGPLSFPLSLAYTYTRGEFDSSFQSQDPVYGDVTEGDHVPYLPRHQFNGSLAVASDIASGFASVTYVAAMREVAGDEPLSDTLSTDSQLWLDLGASFYVTSYIELYAQLRNALESQNIVSRRPLGARPNAPRWLQVGAKLRL